MKVKRVELESGEIVDCFEERADGIATDAGLISWDFVAGYWCRSRDGQVMFVPK